MRRGRVARAELENILREPGQLAEDNQSWLTAPILWIDRSAP